MREQTELLIQNMSENRQKRKRRLALITALAMLTGGNVFWELREVGTALTEEQLCTLEAHEHTDACYDADGTLVCSLEEHTHTAACFSDAAADIETPETWETTLPDRTGLTRQEQAALIAQSQLGYTASEQNFIRSDDGTQHGYTRYGEWYGNPYGEWNTMFTYFCLSYAGVNTEEIPCGGNARTWQTKLSESDLIRGPDSEPERGSIILLDLNKDGEADRTGIITETGESLKVVEGDCGNTVAETEYAPDAEQILGYVALPEPDTPTESVEETPQETEPEIPEEETAEESAEEPAAETSETEGGETGSGTETEQVTFQAESPTGIQVSAVTAEGVFPSGTVMTVEDVAREDALQAAAEGLSGDTETLDAVAVDISFIAADGTELEPDGGVDVEITLPEALYLSGSEYDLLHVSDEGEVQRVVEAEISQNGAGFTAESFSMYVLIAGKAVEKSNVVMLNGDEGNNSQTNPYVIGIGENIEVWYSGEYIDKPDQYSRGFTVYQNSDNKVKRTPGKESEIIEGEYRKAFFTGNSEGVCQIIKTTGTGDWGSNDSIADYLWVKVVDHPIFIMQYGKRVLLNDSTISASVGDTISLSVNGSHPELLAPVDGSDTSQGYKISDTLYRGKPKYDNGNTFVNFVCTEAGTTELNVNGKNITVNITNDKLFRVIGNNRYGVNNNDVLKVYGNEFVLSVYGQNAHLLAPDGSWDQTYTFCNGFLERVKPEESDYGTVLVDGVPVNTTNVRFRCLGTGTSDSFNANSKSIRVNVSPIYMVADDGERVPLDEALLDMNKYTDRRLYGVEGEKFTFSFDGKDNNQIADIDENYFDVVAVNVNDNTNVTITCKKHFEGEKTFKASGEEFKIKVEHPIYVVEALHERDIDRINEWLANYQLPKENGYVPNQIKTVPWDYDRRYQVFDGDDLVLRVPLNDDLSSASLVLQDPSLFEVTGGSLTDDGKEIYVKLKAKNTTNGEINTQIDLKDDNGKLIRPMYIVIKKRDNTNLNHADIEIADGGKYSITKIKRNADGTFEKTIVLYDAYIGEINSGIVYKANGEVCERFLRENGDYWKDPNLKVGDPQFEYTSAYKKDKYGNVTSFSNKSFSLSDAETVVFDTDLELIPCSVQTIQYNAQSQETSNSTRTYTNAERETHEYRKNVVFTMGHQDIIDAVNKCPLHNGLDFTITAFSALVEFDLNKDLTGGTIQENQFSFDLLDKNDTTIQTSSNKVMRTASGETKGVVTFDALKFNTPGEYTYRIREQKGKADHILYDGSVIEVKISVTKDSMNNLIADIISPSSFKDLTFTNHTTYRLPDTGGVGNLPYYLGGTVLLAASALLFEKKRREGR